jgi:1-acyl-sn-glycerol-3-phosphate acyltransferase
LLSGLFAAELSVPQIFLVAAILNAAVAIYIYTLLPEFLLRFVVWIMSCTMYRLKLVGDERVPQTGAAVLVCNHVSFVDFMIVAGSVRRPIRFVMDHRIAATPGLSLVFKAGKTIPIAPAHEDKALMDAAFDRIAAELSDGEIVCIFPEGKLTKSGEMNPFKGGIERIIARTPVPVVPMALHGLWGSMFSRIEKSALKLPRRFRSQLALVVGEPIAPEQVTAALLEERVRALLSDAERMNPGSKLASA